MTSLWVPGDWPTTNRALDLARADGWYQSKRAMLGLRACASPERSYVQWARWGRTMVNAEARRALRGWRPEGMVGVVVYLVATTMRPDPDAWGIAAKWCVDGLVDAKVLTNDRDSVAFTAGRVIRSADEGREAFRRCDRRWTGHRPGLLVELLEQPEGQVLPCLLPLSF